MIKHSQAKTAWEAIFNPTHFIKQQVATTIKGEDRTYLYDKRLALKDGSIGFPFNEMLDEVSHRNLKTPIVVSIATLNKYFLSLTVETKVVEYNMAQQKWLSIMQFFPSRLLTVQHQALHTYFIQTLHYTPISIYSGKPLLYRRF